MSYVRKVLQEGEQIAYETKLSWAMYVPGVLVLLAAVVAFAIVRALLDNPWWGDSVGIVLAVVGLYLVATEWFKRWTTEIAITDRRVILKTGFIRRDTIEMSIQKVESVDVEQSLLGRMLDYGDVVIRGTGAGLAPIRKIDRPLQFRSHVTAA